MDRITFKVNGNKYSVGSEESSDIFLLEYIRDRIQLKGTKFMCKEAGCGSCIVAVTAPDPYTGHPRTFSVNSCIVAITQCQDWSITTIEGIGDRRQGYHPISSTLAEYNGTQCGFCSVGWVMAMYSFLESKHYDVTQYQVEDAFGSNICRCTGYRPILQAFRSFAKDAPPRPHPKVMPDIEDLSKCKKSCETPCGSERDWCLVHKEDTQERGIKKIVLKDNKLWFRVTGLKDIFAILDAEGYDDYMLVGGNTGKGAIPILAPPRVQIDINPVWELRQCYLDQNLVIGGNTKLTDLLDIFKKYSSEYEEFWYLEKLYEHINLVAHNAVRNIGSIAGNYMLKHKDHTFSSDLFLLSECVGAMLTILGRSGQIIQSTLVEFLNIDMKGRVIVNVKFPPLGASYKFTSLKIMPRSQSAHAQVNEAVLYKFAKDGETIEFSRITFGGLSGTFNRAYETEKYIKGKKIFTNEVLQNALRVLEKELFVTEIPGDMSPAFRRKLAIGLFYKTNIQLIPEDRLKPIYRSGRRDIRRTRPLSESSQVFDTNPIIWPMTEPYPKLDALIQCSGEAKYSGDLPVQPQEVFAAFVTADVYTGEIESIDPTPALKIPGVLQFFSAKDIPGINNFLSPKVISYMAVEEIFCSGRIKYYDQPIGIIVAENDRLARRAALLVEVRYRTTKKEPMLTIQDVKEKDPSRISLFMAIPARDRGADVQRIIKGTDNIFGQYYYTMETLTSVARPSENGVELFSSQKWPDATQQCVADVLSIPTNRVAAYIDRVGGSYGSRISRSNLVSTASALVTYLMNRPCRFTLSIQEMTRIIGKRAPCTREFEVGVNNEGEIQYMEYHLYEDNGYVFSDQLIVLAAPAVKNCYDNRRWQTKLFNVTTDTASNSWMRAPGTLEAIAMTEYVMERISYELDRDPLDIRMRNLSVAKDPNIIRVIDQLKEDSDYENRKKEVEQFNKINRWKKRGLRLALMSWPETNVSDYQVLLTVYHGDGSISVSTGGVEVGQGLNTRVIQIVAYTLKISTAKIRIEPTTTQKNPNTIATGGSRTTEIVCLGAIKCCQIILDRLQSIRDKLNNPTWELLVETAYLAGINLQASYHTTANDVFIYQIAGGAVVEAELDVLTGEFEIRRTDLVIDVGTSINPVLDLGQVEGCFVMGMGYWTTEELIYDRKNGELLTDRTWNYYVPVAKDIPLDFRVKFLRNSYNPLGVLGARALAEPPTTLAISVGFAIRHAIAASREDRGFPRTDFFQVDGPYSISNNVLALDVRTEEFLYY